MTENSLADLLNISGEAIFAWQLNGGIIYWNNGASKKYGFCSQEVIGKISKDLLKTVYPIKIDEIKEILVRDGIWNGELEHTNKDGNKLIAKTTMKLVHNEHGELIIIETNRDITQYRKMDEELLLSKELLETVIENIPEPFAIYDNKGNLIKMNAAGRKLYPSQEIMKTLENVHNSFQFFDVDGNEIPFINLPTRRALRGELVKNDIIVIKREEKDQITEVITAPIFDRDHNVICIAAFHRDITEKYQNQILIKSQQDTILLAEIEKNKALKKTIDMKDEFLSLISHEFRTPLTIINSAIQTMEIVCKNELSEKAKKYLDKIQQNSYRQLKLINNILDNTRINTGHFKLKQRNMDIVSLTRMITESIMVFAERKNIKISFSSTMGKKVIGIDEEQYERILLNLLSNAVKFTLEEGSIDVRIYQLIALDNHKVCIEVKDNGIGIPTDKKEYIFERFGQVDSTLIRQAEGTGIGLTLVKMLVEMLSGEIKLESDEGVGSTFTVILPDVKIMESLTEQTSMGNSNERLIKAAVLEFSDIYC